MTLHNFLHNFLHNANSTLVPNVVWAQSPCPGFRSCCRYCTRAQVDRCSWSWFSSCDSRAAPGTRTSCAARTLRHHRWAACCAPVALHESIRYAPGDHVEQWLNQLLCLDTASRAVPCPKNCDLYPSYWVFNLGFWDTTEIRIWRHFRWSAFATVRHRGRVNLLKVDINFTSSGSSIFLVHNLCCDKYI